MPRSPDLGHLIHHFQHSEESRRETVNGNGLDPRLALLRAWQSVRLAQSYADLLANASFEPACRFFLSDVYAARDFTQRDHDVERVHSFLSRLMPPPTILLLTELIELNHLTAALDRALLSMLVGPLGLTDAIAPAMYAEGYRLCNNEPARLYQIELIEKLLIQVGEVAQMRGTGLLLAAVRRPIEAAGWDELYDFVARGHAAFRPMRDYRGFAQTVAHRERQLLSRIYAGDPNPFD